MRRRRNDDGGKPEASSKKICKIGEDDTVSRVRRRICKTEAEWNGKAEGAKPEPDRFSKQSQ